MIETLILACGVVVLTGFAFYVEYKRHLQRTAKNTLRFEKEKHYLRRDQRARLKAAKARKKELDMIAKEKADIEAKNQEMKAISDTLQSVIKTREG